MADVPLMKQEEKMHDCEHETGFTEAELLEHIPAVRQFARRFHAAPTDVDDLVQETLTKAIANSAKFRRGTQLRSWLFTILRNSFCSKYGLAKRESVGLGEDSAAWVIIQPSQEWSVRGRELEKAIAALPVHYQTALELIFVDGQTYEDAAHRCGCPVGTMKSRVNRARLQLSKFLMADAI
ncbi:sigma-70 family RNA polymerase sigma factor [Neorhizobium sp. T6_25]|uniref:sigma-70 family RNA polymerase sigma factor n=1 Tax=Neorhizobium sp. T6_25 TaxID=2093833 RepID=UPI001FE18884|nr:sigma-70 family RNA polymerase sigma factor [Neorhizobium sp. T6_25]